MTFFFDPLLPDSANSSGGAEFADAVFSAAGLGTAQAEGAAIADAVFFVAGLGTAQAVGAGGLPDEEVVAEALRSASAGGGSSSLYISDVRKKKKPAPIVNTQADVQAESDFRILWEAVKIRQNPDRIRAAIAKRAAILADLENATLIRDKRS